MALDRRRSLASAVRCPGRPAARGSSPGLAPRHPGGRRRVRSALAIEDGSSRGPQCPPGQRPIIAGDRRVVLGVVDQTLCVGHPIDEVRDGEPGEVGFPQPRVQLRDRRRVLVRRQRGWCHRVVVRPQRDGEVALVVDPGIHAGIQPSRGCGGRGQAARQLDFELGAGPPIPRSHASEHVTWTEVHGDAVRVVQDNGVVDGEPARRGCGPAGGDRARDLEGIHDSGRHRHVNRPWRSCITNAPSRATIWATSVRMPDTTSSHVTPRRRPGSIR